MSSVVISGDTSGSITIASPAVAGTYTQTLPMITGTLGTLNSGTAVASTSGTSIDFTSIPANVRRITVMFNGVSTSGTSLKQIQIGAGSVDTTGYLSGSSFVTNASASNATTATTGFVLFANAATDSIQGSIVFSLFGNNIWVAQGVFYQSAATPFTILTSGSKTLSGTLDRVRITTVNGTDTFDAGSINILYE